MEQKRFTLFCRNAYVFIRGRFQKNGFNIRVINFRNIDNFQTTFKNRI